MNNRMVLAIVLGQAVVTLVAIGYGVSAHSSWEAERQRRIDGERAAVAEMAAAMKGASDRLAKVEQDLKRCRSRARRTARTSPAPPAPAVAEVALTGTPVAPGPEAAFDLLTGAVAWAPAPGVEVAARPTPAAPAAVPWCQGRYEPARGTNFAPCPSPPPPTAAAGTTTAAHAPR